MWSDLHFGSPEFWQISVKVDITLMSDLKVSIDSDYFQLTNKRKVGHIWISDYQQGL